MLSEARRETPSDGFFGVAMTLLILEAGLPDDFHPRDGAELLQGLIGLWSSALLLIVSSLMAIALSFVNSKVARRALALNFAGSVIRVWSRGRRLRD